MCVWGGGRVQFKHAGVTAILPTTGKNILDYLYRRLKYLRLFIHPNKTLGDTMSLSYFYSLDVDFYPEEGDNISLGYYYAPAFKGERV